MRFLRIFFSIIWKIYFGLFFFVSTVVFYPIILPFLFSETNKKRSFKLFVAWSWCVRIFGFYPVKKVIDSELPEGPFIIIANHASYLDIFLLPSIMPKDAFLFLGKSEILKYPLIKTYFKRLNIPVYRGGIKAVKSLISASQEINKGWSLVIFPEGEIPKIEHPKMIPFMAGAFQLAKNAKVPIVPITFLNNYKRLSDLEEPLGLAGPGVCKVYIHPFIATKEVENLSKAKLNQKCFDIVNGPIKKVVAKIKV
tara:strand:+ start:2879 stop:3637 length:759 start_codon:yes stop_codon:yes gene_type:complete